MKKETMQYRIENNLCTRCAEPVVVNRRMCCQHLEENRLKEKLKREKRKSKNLCTMCGQKPPVLNRTKCSTCANSNKDVYNASKMDIYYQRRSSGDCVRCGKAVNNFSVHCDVCTIYMKDKDKKYYHKIKENGLCVHCRLVSPVDGKILCLICKNKNSLSGKDSRVKQKMNIMQQYGGKCKFCDEKDIAVLSIDHIDGGGTRHRKELKKQGINLYRWLVKNNYPTGFQVLCFNCNMKKYINGIIS